MNAMFPRQVTLEAFEQHRINRARLAKMLHRLPGEIDAAPAQDIHDLIAVTNMDLKLQERMQKS